MYFVLRQWIIDTKIGPVDMEQYLDNLREMQSVRDGISERSNSPLIDVIGVINSWLMNTSKMSMHKDGEKNTTSFYSRK